MVSMIATTVIDSAPHMSGISDLEIAWIDGIPMLYLASEGDGGLTVFSIDGGVITYLDQIGYSSNRGTAGVSDIDIITLGGQGIIVPSGRHDDRLAFHKLDANGELNGIKVLGGDSTQIGNLEHSIQLEIEGKVFMVSSQWGQDGFRSYRLRDDLSVEPIRKFDDNATAHSGDITAMTAVEYATRSFFFVASGTDAGVTCYWMGKYGNVKERGSLGPENGLGVSNSTALETAVVDGKLFVFLGSAGTGSITVIRVNEWGGLFIEDNHLDDLNSRFGGVQALEAFEFNGRSFLLAGGSDDGITLFEIEPGGGLNILQVIEDSTSMTLQNVNSIVATEVGGEINVIVSGSEMGITQFTIDFGNLGGSITGTDAAENLTGTAADDLIAGYDGNDTIAGGAGNDRIIDGSGADTMTGGSGADTFVFLDDGLMDTVTDFELGQDKLDLTDFAMLYTMGQLNFTQKGYGVLITLGDDRFRLTTNGDQLLVSDLTPDDFIF